MTIDVMETASFRSEFRKAPRVPLAMELTQHSVSTANNSNVFQMNYSPNKDEAFTYPSKVYQIIKGSNMRLPLNVEVRVTPTYVSVTDKVTDISGIGHSVSEAKIDFQQAIIDYRDTLNAESDLSPQLRSLLLYLITIS